MKKKLLAILMATAMSIALIACGGGEEEAATNETTVEADAEEEAEVESEVEYTEEQAAFAQEYLDLCEAYDAAVDKVNATPKLLEDQELVDGMNELTAVIDEVDGLFADPELLTTEAMDELRVAFDEVYVFIDDVNSLVDGTATASEVDEIASVLTIAYAGADEAENTYYFVCDEEVTFGAFVILSADMTQSVNCVGEIVDNGDGTVTINDETGYYITFLVEEAEGGLLLTLEDETVVAMASWDATEVVEMIFAIDEETEIVNQ